MSTNTTEHPRKRITVNRVCWVTIRHSLIGWLTYAAFWEQQRGALNVLTFWIWVHFALSLCLLSDSMRKSVTKSGPPLLPRSLAMALGMSLVGVLVWHGEALLGTMHTLALALWFGAFAMAEEKKGAEA